MLTSPTFQIKNLVPVYQEDATQQYNLIVPQILSNKINATPSVYVKNSGQASVVRADLLQPSIGNDILINIYQSGTLYASLDIPVGSTLLVLNSTQLVALPALVAGNLFRVDITQVGGQFPGANLTITIVC